MLNLRFVAGMFSAGLMVASASVASGQAFPNKSIRIVTGGVGGATDRLSRFIADRLTDVFGKPVIVENRSSGIIPIETVSKAAPDGYSLLVNGNSFWIIPLLRKVPYDPVRDFSPITIATSGPSILTVNPKLPVNSVWELVALAKAKPGTLNYSAGAVGSSTHMATLLFASMAGINIVHIQFKSFSASINATISGETQIVIGSASSLMPHVTSGKVKALAVTTAQPSALAPGLPTVSASGVPGYRVDSLVGMWAPAKTPASIINRLNQEIVRALNRADIKEDLFKIGVEPVGSSPGELAAVMKSETATLSKLIKDAGIRTE